MKKFTLLALVLLLFFGCVSSSRLLHRGRFDAAIEKSVKALMKNPTKENEILVLERAFNIANDQDSERIRFLQKGSNPRDTEEIVYLLSRMKRRQTLVRTVTPLRLADRTVQFPYIDYDNQIISAKSAATEHHYQTGLALMQRREKQAKRDAFSSFVRVKELSGNFKRVDSLLAEARHQGVSRVLVSVKNNSHLNLPEEYVQNLLTVDPRGLDNEWLEFFFSDLDKSIDFDYFINVNLRNIIVSPDQTKTQDRQVTKKVEDGFEYILDANGNVRKDSLGNDIKVQKYKNLVCAVVETHQHKSIVIEGDLEIFSATPYRLIKREPLGASSNFDHISARAIGDVNALDENTKKLVQVSPLPFPSDVEMIIRTSNGFRNAIASAMRTNRRLLF